MSFYCAGMREVNLLRDRARDRHIDWSIFSLVKLLIFFMLSSIVKCFFFHKHEQTMFSVVYESGQTSVSLVAREMIQVRALNEQSTPVRVHMLWYDSICRERVRALDLNHFLSKRLTHAIKQSESELANINLKIWYNQTKQIICFVFYCFCNHSKYYFSRTNCPIYLHGFFSKLKLK